MVKRFCVFILKIFDINSKHRKIDILSNRLFRKNNVTILLIHEILSIYGISSAIYTHRNRLLKFLLKYKIGKIFLGIIFAPFFIVLSVVLYKMYQDPEMRRIIANVNAQKKISDFT
jgi:hypothetical protein